MAAKFTPHLDLEVGEEVKLSNVSSATEEGPKYVPNPSEEQPSKHNGQLHRNSPCRVPSSANTADPTKSTTERFSVSANLLWDLGY